jgi:hypothetical protein
MLLSIILQFLREKQGILIGIKTANLHAYVDSWSVLFS